MHLPPCSHAGTLTQWGSGGPLGTSVWKPAGQNLAAVTGIGGTGALVTACGFMESDSKGPVGLTRLAQNTVGSAIHVHAPVRVEALTQGDGAREATCQRGPILRLELGSLDVHRAARTATQVLHGVAGIVGVICMQGGHQCVAGIEGGPVEKPDLSLSVLGV
jgi:hypothetical protein